MAKKAIFDKKNILVVGGAGFIGSHLCDALVEDSKVICLDNFFTGVEDNIAHLYQDPNFEFVNHDITNPIDLEKEPSLDGFRVEFQGLQAIYFLASPTSPQDYITKPIETILINSVGLRYCLDMAVKYKAQFLYASSPVVYGDTVKEKLVTENYVGLVNHLGPRACYAEAMRLGETLVNSYKKIHNLDTKIVRIANAYGPNMKLTDGRMIPEIIKATLDNQEITIYGDKKSAGSYCYITDVVKALTMVMNSAENGPMNIGSDWEIAFATIADKVIKLTESKSKIKFTAPTDAMVNQLIPNISLAKEALGWFPIVLIDEGLKNTIDFLSAQRGVLDPEELNK